MSKPGADALETTELAAGTESLRIPRWSKGDSNSPSHPERQLSDDRTHPESKNSAPACVYKNPHARSSLSYLASKGRCGPNLVGSMPMRNTGSCPIPPLVTVNADGSGCGNATLPIAQLEMPML
jgi:hypothetical protein